MKLAVDPGVDATPATSTARVRISAKRFTMAAISRLRVAILASAQGRKASPPLPLTKLFDECVNTPCYASFSNRANLSGTKLNGDSLNKPERLVGQCVSSAAVRSAQGMASRRPSGIGSPL